MSPSFTVKHGVRYPFYVSSALLRGRKSNAGSVARVSAPTIEGAVLRTLRQHVEVNDNNDLLPYELIERYVDRVTLEAKRVLVSLKGSGEKPPSSLEIPWSVGGARHIAQVENDRAGQASQRSSPQLVQAIVRAHEWLRSLTDGTYDSIESLARAVDLHPKVVRNKIHLAFLGPKLTRDFLHGKQPGPISLNELASAAQLSWRQQQDRCRS